LRWLLGDILEEVYDQVDRDRIEYVSQETFDHGARIDQLEVDLEHETVELGRRLDSMEESLPFEECA
jgi:hypothetical protein